MKKYKKYIKRLLTAVPAHEAGSSFSLESPLSVGGFLAGRLVRRGGGQRMERARSKLLSGLAQRYGVPLTIPGGRGGNLVGGHGPELLD